MPKVGASSYIAFYETNIHGDVLENFVPGFITQFIKLGKKLVFFYTLIIFSIFSSFPTLKRVEEGRDFGLSQNLCLWLQRTTKRLDLMQKYIQEYYKIRKYPDLVFGHWWRPFVFHVAMTALDCNLRNPHEMLWGKFESIFDSWVLSFLFENIK